MRLVLLFFLLSCLSVSASAAEMLVTGIYRGTNLYLENPKASTGSFCISRILLNDQPVSYSQTTAIEVDLSALKYLDPIVLKIYHADDCTPRVVNMSAIRTEQMFQFTKIDVNSQHLVWETVGEKPESQFFILKYEHNEWVVESALDARGYDQQQLYELPARHHSGANKYRIRYMDITGKEFLSPEIDFTAEKETVQFYPRRASDFLYFTSPVKFKVLDQYGKELFSGEGKKADLKSLPRGLYYISFDNRTDSFFKKK